MDIDGSDFEEFSQLADQFAEDMGDSVDDGVDESITNLRRRLIGIINQRQLISEDWRQTDGPSMNTFAAWPVTKLSNGQYTVRPHPKVRTRAIALEFGRDPAQHASPETTMTFQVDSGEWRTITAEQMDPRDPDAEFWWRPMVQRWQAEDDTVSEVSDKIEQLMFKYFGKL